MSKNENTVTLKKTYEFYDENLVAQTKEVEVAFTPALTYEEGVQRLNADTAKILEGINAILRREVLLTARKECGASGGINREVLMNWIRPNRELPQFAKMVTATDKRKVSAEEWNKQTQAILDEIKNVPYIMNAIKTLSTQAEEE